jgi:hypothetical protein
MKEQKIYKMSFAVVYTLYVKKAERKNRTQSEVDQVILWLTGYDRAGLKKQIKIQADFETFFKNAPKLNPNVALITGTVCGVRVENVKGPLLQKIRYLDKLVDELAHGKDLAKILRSPDSPKKGAPQKVAPGRVKTDKAPKAKAKKKVRVISK